MAPIAQYDVYYTEQAAAARDRLDDQQRIAFDKGIELLARDPFLSVSRPISATGDDRTIRLTQNVMVEYTVSRGRLLIFIVEVFNDKDVLIPGEG
ncbi:type II toxin-antitoxin system RelE/ParE family toxin [Streptomyces sp. NPDC001480]|uniref:type II toxin-antitoxin system RelE family toxin n=1 Tax=Streptomyces sp. NPDC001480 TaxID=3364577 RepID=UPI0036BFB509